MNENKNTKIERVKKHIKDNKKTYVVVGVTTTLAFIAGVVIGHRDSIIATITSNGNHNNTIVGKVKHVTIMQAELERRGHPGNVVLCNETGELFASQNRAATLLDINPARLSEHLNGQRNQVKGLTFQTLGEAA